MSEEDLELLITLDDPGEEEQEDTFNHHAENTLQYWLGQTLAASCQLDQRGADNDACTVAFGQGDWTCTLSRLTGTTNESIKSLNGSISEPIKEFDIEVCTVTRRRRGEIVEQKVFYDLVGIPKQFGGHVNR